MRREERGRRRSRSRGRRPSINNNPAVVGPPPSYDDASPFPAAAAEEALYYAPPQRNLTGNITSLFRRGSGNGATGTFSEEVPTTTATIPRQRSSSRRRRHRSRSRGRRPRKEDEIFETSTADATGPRFVDAKTSSNNRGFPFFRKSHHQTASANPASPVRPRLGGKDNYPPAPSSINQSRLFYSTHGDAQDSDDEDSYESSSLHSRSMLRTTSATEDPVEGSTCVTGSTTTTATAHSSTLPGQIPTILRYRGFSTSIQSLFLDEALVCASMGCFGLVLSNRTENLLQLRNDRRGVRWGRSTSRRTLPSRMVAYALMLTLVFMTLTFLIWGFGSSSSQKYSEGFYDGSNNNSNNNYNNYNGDDANGDDDDAGQNDDYYNNGNGRRGLDATSNLPLKQKKTHSFHGICKLQDMHESIWKPAMDLIQDEWYRDGLGSSHYLSERHLQQHQQQSRSLNSGQRSHHLTGDLAADLRLAFFIVFMVVLGVLGRRRRMRTRYYLVRARAQEDHLFYASSAAGVKRVAFQDSREDQYEGACSHTLCGCYPADPPQEGDEIEDDDVKVDDDGVKRRKKKPHHHDCVSRGFSLLMSCCCGFLCRCWCQCMSICALAQEAREIRLLVPTRFQRVDFITHQPFHEYHQKINELRSEWLGASGTKLGFMAHFQAISRLSRYILASFLMGFTLIAATLVFNPRASFAWPDLIILIATFVQSFLVIFFVHWIFHKSDLSFDAVIKFFAAGFLLAVPAAFLFEGLLVNITLTLTYSAWTIGDKISESFSAWVVNNFRILWIIGELFNAYIVAAVTEELCKYYTFRCVEHPDLIFLTGLAKAAQDARALAGGIVKYPFSPNQVQETNKMDAYDDDDDRSVGSRVSHRSTSKSRKKSRSINEAFEINMENPLAKEEELYEEEEPDIRTYRQKAMAVTTGMISVAVGLACAENFLYVFLLGGSEANAGDSHSGGVLEEWIVLLFRSLFPIHALAAAMQSINVVRKYIECDTVNSHRIGIGRIILPAVILHGTFDAVLLSINIYIETAWDNYLAENDGNYDEDDPPYNPVIVNLVAWISIIVVMVAGLFWYYRENRLQRDRLVILEEEEKAAGKDKNYQSPEVAGRTKRSRSRSRSNKKHSVLELV